MGGAALSIVRGLGALARAPARPSAVCIDAGAQLLLRTTHDYLALRKGRLARSEFWRRTLNTLLVSGAAVVLTLMLTYAGGACTGVLQVVVLVAGPALAAVLTNRLSQALGAAQPA
jgi:hypothetical protein